MVTGVHAVLMDLGRLGGLDKHQSTAVVDIVNLTASEKEFLILYSNKIPLKNPLETHTCTHRKIISQAYGLPTSLRYIAVSV